MADKTGDTGRYDFSIPQQSYGNPYSVDPYKNTGGDWAGPILPPPPEIHPPPHHPGGGDIIRSSASRQRPGPGGNMILNTNNVFDPNDPGGSSGYQTPNSPSSGMGSGSYNPGFNAPLAGNGQGVNASQFNFGGPQAQAQQTQFPQGYSGPGIFDQQGRNPNGMVIPQGQQQNSTNSGGGPSDMGAARTQQEAARNTALLQSTSQQLPTLFYNMIATNTQNPMGAIQQMLASPYYAGIAQNPQIQQQLQQLTQQYQTFQQQHPGAAIGSYGSNAPAGTGPQQNTWGYNPNTQQLTNMWNAAPGGGVTMPGAASGSGGTSPTPPATGGGPQTPAQPNPPPQQFSGFDGPQYGTSTIPSSALTGPTASQNPQYNNQPPQGGGWQSILGALLPGLFGGGGGQQGGGNWNSPYGGGGNQFLGFPPQGGGGGGYQPGFGPNPTAYTGFNQTPGYGAGPSNGGYFGGSPQNSGPLPMPQGAGGGQYPQSLSQYGPQYDRMMMSLNPSYGQPSNYSGGSSWPDPGGPGRLGANGNPGVWDAQGNPVMSNQSQTGYPNNSWVPQSQTFNMPQTDFSSLFSGNGQAQPNAQNGGSGQTQPAFNPMNPWANTGNRQPTFGGSLGSMWGAGSSSGAFRPTWQGNGTGSGGGYGGYGYNTAGSNFRTPGGNFLNGGY